NQVSDSTANAYPKGVIETDDGDVWQADFYQGLTKRNDAQSSGIIIPQGPNSAESDDIYAHNGEVWVAHGGYNGNLLAGELFTGVSRFKDEEWLTYQRFNYPLFGDSVHDFVCLTKDERDGTLYAGTVNGGIWTLKADGSSSIIKQGALDPPYG